MRSKCVPMAVIEYALPITTMSPNNGNDNDQYFSYFMALNIDYISSLCLHFRNGQRIIENDWFSENV